MDAEKPFASVERIAANLGIPESWLRDEVEAGRVPCLRAGKRILLSRDVVERTLLERASTSTTLKMSSAIDEQEGDDGR
jgi:hypothetical protein